MKTKLTIIFLFCFSFAFASAGSARDLGSVIVVIIIFLCSIVGAIFLAGLIKKKIRNSASGHCDINSTSVTDRDFLSDTNMYYNKNSD